MPGRRDHREGCASAQQHPPQQVPTAHDPRLLQAGPTEKVVLAALDLALLQAGEVRWFG